MDSGDGEVGLVLANYEIIIMKKVSQSSSSAKMQVRCVCHLPSFFYYNRILEAIENSFILAPFWRFQLMTGPSIWGPGLTHGRAGNGASHLCHGQEKRKEKGLEFGGGGD